MHGSICMTTKLRIGRFDVEIKWSFAERLLLENNFIVITIGRAVPTGASSDLDFRAAVHRAMLQPQFL